MSESEKDEIEELGLHPISCREDCGGKPRCRIGQLTGNWKPRTIQLQGACASDVLAGRRPIASIQRQYKVVIVGEAPGKQEDKSGLPFQGDAGGHLQNFILDAGFELEEVYITNLVKCRPPKNRKPSASEIKACLTHVYHEIRTIQPEVIMLLGANAIKLFNLDGIGGITKIRGKIFKKTLPHWEDGPVFKVVPTYHPAFFCYKSDSKLMARVTEDFKLAAALVNRDEVDLKDLVYDCKYTVADTPELVAKMVDTVRQHGIFAWDTESPDARFRESPMRLLQVSIGKDRNWVVPFYKHNPEALGLWKMDPWFTNGDRDAVIASLRQIFENPDIPKIGHYLKYDMNVLRQWTGLETKGWLWDTAPMHHLIYEYIPHNLEYLASLEFGYGDYSCPIREITGHGKDLRQTYDMVPDDILYKYGATDAEASYRLQEIYYEVLKLKPNLLKVYEEESYHTIRSLQEMEWVGNKIIVDNVKVLEKSLAADIEDLEAKCRSYTTPDFNPNAPEQVSDAFIKLGFSDKILAPLTPSGKSSAKDILLEIDHPLAQHVIDYRNRTKMMGTYVTHALEDLSKDGRLRYPFNPIGTVNGGLSCRLFQQVPKLDKDKVAQGEMILRSIFGEEEGFWYFYADFSQIELRIFAYLAGEQELIDVLESNGDIHRTTAAAALDIAFEDCSQFNRDAVGKPLNFGTIYGSQGHKISKVIYEDPKTKKKQPVGLKRALEFVKNFRARYKKVDEFLSLIPERALCNGGVLELPFGRERRILGLNDPDENVRGRAEREITNAMIQAPARAITIRTMNQVRLALEHFRVGTDKVRALNTVHDSLAYGVRDDLKDWFPVMFKEVAERPIPEIFNKSFPIDWGIGRNWTEAELNSK